MKKIIKVEVENYGKVILENHGDYYYTTDENGNMLGEIYPNEIDDWDESDERILSEIIEELFEDGTLETPYMDCDNLFDDI